MPDEAREVCVRMPRSFPSLEYMSTPKMVPVENSRATSASTNSWRFPLRELDLSSLMKRLDTEGDDPILCRGGSPA